MLRRHLPVAPVLAGILVLSLAPGAAAAGFGAPIGVRIEDEGIDTQLTDLWGLGTQILATFDVHGAPSVEAGVIGRQDETKPFSLATVEGANLREAQCPGHIAAAWDQPAGVDRDLAVATEAGQLKVHQDGTSFTRPDVACLGSDHQAVTVLITSGTDTQVFVFPWDGSTSSIGLGYALGPARATSSPVVAETSTGFVVAWLDGAKLRLQRWSASAPPVQIAMGSKAVLASGPGLANPQIAAAGKQVIVTWEQGHSVMARVSTDGGATFKPRQTLLAGFAAKAAHGTNADALGRTLLASVTQVSGGTTATGWLLRSTNAGRTWSKVAGSTRRGGFVLGALGGKASSPTLILAWDRRVTAPTRGRILIAIGS
ncbi:MAG: hypothetical protein U0869_03200 [Chloroflexota bacterium]